MVKNWQIALLIVFGMLVNFLMAYSDYQKMAVSDVREIMVEETELSEEEMEHLDIVYYAGGCFWGVQKFFDQFAGVVKTETGYANGGSSGVSYQEVCGGSGHAETVKVIYDPSQISLKELTEYYFLIIDPTSINKQGNDVGVQYRTGIYYEKEEDAEVIWQVYKTKEEEEGRSFVVEVEMLSDYTKAESYHQNYLQKVPNGYCHIPSKYFNIGEKELKGVELESKEELIQRIGQTAYDVTQNGATEYPYTGAYDGFFEKGIYVDVVSGQPLFSSLDKYESGCGWPAFSKPIEEGALSERTDYSYNMVRTQVRSTEAGSILGHVFEDGPIELGGLRYCINSAALKFIPYDEMEEQGYGAYKALFDE